MFDVVAYNVGILASGEGGGLKKFCPMVIRCVLRTKGGSCLRLCRPVYFVRATQSLPQPGHEYWQVFHNMLFTEKAHKGWIKAFGTKQTKWYTSFCSKWNH